MSSPSSPEDLAPALPAVTHKDKTLKEIVEMMDEYAPVVPDAVTDYYLAKNGFECLDVRIKRVLALATQKFILDVATDAFEHLRIRAALGGGGQAKARAALALQQAGSGGSASSSSTRVVLTTEDLSAALAEYGLNVNKPEFYR